MSELAVPKHNTNTLKSGVPIQMTSQDSSLEDSLHSETDLTNDDPEILLRESKSQHMFLTKTGGLFVVYTGCFVLVNFFIILNMVKAKILYRSMNMMTMTWVYFALCIVIKLLGGFGNRCLKKVQSLLFIVDCILSSFVYFGIYWFCETVNSSAYEYNGHYVIIVGFCLAAMSMGYMFSTLIRFKNTKYNVFTGVIMMSLFVIGTLIAVANIWTIHTMKSYQYCMVFFWFLVLELYIAINSNFILKLRLEKYYDHEMAYCFFCFCTDWIAMFWVDLCKNMFKSKKKRKSRSVAVIERR